LPESQIMIKDEIPFDDIKLSVVVLFYHGERWIDSCVGSLEKQSLSRDAYEIILVDNGGSTPSIYNFKEFHNIKIISSRLNLGFTEGNNRALEHTRGEIILLINQDVVVDFFCLEKVLNAFISHPEAGVIGASMLMASEKDMGSTMTKPQYAGFYKLTRYGFARYCLRKPRNPIFPLDFVSGNGLGFRKGMLKDLNGYLFDARLFSYAEDLDFSLRIAQTPWKMYLHSGAIIHHFRDQAFAGHPGQRLRKLIRISSNRLLVYANRLNLKSFLKKLPLLVLGIPLKVGRLDGDAHFNFYKFVIAFLLIPLILLHFVLRIPLKK